MPPSLGRLVYRHAGTPKFFTPNSGIPLAALPKIEKADKPFASTPMGLAGLFRLMPTPPAFLGDHAPANYRALFEGR